MLHPYILSFSNIFSTVSIYWGSLTSPRKFLTTSMNAFHSWHSMLFTVFVNAESFKSFWICGPPNIPSFTLASDKMRNLMLRSLKHEPLLSSTLTNCFKIPSFMCKGGNKIFCLSTTLAFLDPWNKSFLLCQSFVVQCMSLALVSIHIGDMVTLCILLVVPVTFQESSYCRINTNCAYGIWSLLTPFLNSRRFPWAGQSVGLASKLNCYHCAVILPLSSFLNSR